MSSFSRALTQRYLLTFLSHSFEPLAAREDLALAGVARNVNFVRSVGDVLGMKREEIEDILAREFHQ